MNVRTQVIILLVVGIILISGGLVFMSMFPSIFEKMLTKKLILAPGTETMDSFTSPPIPIYMQFYMFNLTNKDDVVNTGAKPNLQQLGPYTYEEGRLKHDFKWNDDLGIITYRQNKSFYFREDLSEGNLETDKITTINAVMISLASKLSTLPDFAHGIGQIFLKRFNVNPFITRTVGELLFAGYKEPLLKQLGAITKDPVMKTGKFGFFYPKNNTNDGTYTVYTGARGMENYMNIYSWHGQKEVEFWKEDRCNMINGTEGSQFPPPLLRENNVVLFTAELCRSIYATYEKDVQHGPLTLYRYVLPDELLAESDENKCYCPDDFSCRAGMMNIGPCKDGKPVIMSTPHFYQGNIEDARLLIGIEPNKEEHQTYLDLEPNTGVVFRAAKRLQVNMPLRRYADLPALKNVPELIYPILWVNESAVVPLDRSENLHQKLTKPKFVVKVACWGLVALGALLILIGIVRCILNICSNGGDKVQGVNNRKENYDAKDNGVTNYLLLHCYCGQNTANTS
ncbi:unnamed protein product, partial [Meganyctiphanes norvegica]